MTRWYSYLVVRVRRLLVAVTLTSSLLLPTAVSARYVQIEGTKCPKVGQKRTFKKSAFVCTKTSKGSFWISAGKSPGNSSSGSGSGSSANLGDSCKSQGEVAWSQQASAVLVCRSGKHLYALPDDFPATPAGGYTSRPTWYPTLAQVTSPGKSEPTCAASSVKFTHPVVPLDKLTTTIPYGMMTGDHVTPIDHAYLGIASLETPEAQRSEADYVDVTAPAGGTIIELSSLGAPSTNRVVIDHGCGVYTVYMVLNRPSGVLANAYKEMTAKGGPLRLSLPIKAGEVFGRQRDNPLDLNVFDGSQWLSGFASPASYLTADTWKPYTADYLPFFSGAIRTAMEASLQRTTAPRVGKIDHDVIGAAAGNWFLDGTFGYGGNPITTYQNATTRVSGGSVQGKNSTAWSHLSISPHHVDTTRWVFSIGWFSDPKGDHQQMLLEVPAGKPDPSKLTAASGTVVYELYKIGFTYPGSDSGARAPMSPLPVGYTVFLGQPKGSVILQVNADNSLSLEFGTAFTAAKRTYRR